MWPKKKEKKLELTGLLGQIREALQSLKRFTTHETGSAEEDPVRNKVQLSLPVRPTVGRGKALTQCDNGSIIL